MICCSFDLCAFEKLKQFLLSSVFGEFLSQKHVELYKKKIHQPLRWSYGFNPSLYIDMQLLKNVSISGINPTLNKRVQSFYGIGGFFILLVFCWAYLPLFIYVILVSFFFYVISVLVSVWCWYCRMSFGFSFPSRIFEEFQKCMC